RLDTHHLRREPERPHGRAPHLHAIEENEESRREGFHAERSECRIRTRRARLDFRPGDRARRARAEERGGKRRAPKRDGPSLGETLPASSQTPGRTPAPSPAGRP